VTTETQNLTVRSFLRSLNVVLKSARMYGMSHPQTNYLLNDSWKNLQAVLSEKRSSLELTVSGNRLLVQGVAVKSGPAERGIADLFSAIDLTSMTFTTDVTQSALARMVQVFAESGSKTDGVAQELKKILGGGAESCIRINEVGFVRAASGRPETPQVEGLLKDPSQLLQLMTAAGGLTDGSSIRSEHRGGAPRETEEGITAVIRMLAKFAQAGGQRPDSEEIVRLQQQFLGLPEPGQASVGQVLKHLADSTSRKSSETPLLLQMAEDLVVRLAIERYEKGDSRVDAVIEMLNRLNREIDALRATLGTYEQKIKDAGFDLASSTDDLEEKFWAQVSESPKLDVMLSKEAWRIPSRHIRQFVEQLIEQGKAEMLEKVLLNYVNCIHSPLTEARRKTAVGLKHLAELYVRPAGQPLRSAVALVGEQLLKESEPELHSLITTAFVILSQEAATRRRYPAVLQTMSCLKDLEQSQPSIVKSLRSRIGLENRIPDFLEEALRVPEVPAELIESLRRIPLVTAEHIAGRISRCTRRRERDRLVKLAQELGPEVAGVLLEEFQSRPPAAAANMVGLLSQLELASIEKLLPGRLNEWNRVYHDAVVRQIASAGSPGRGRLLAKLLDVLDPLVAPLALDEIGMSGDVTTAPVLLGIAGGELPRLNTPFLRIKAVEAVGRLRLKEAIPLLRQLVETKHSWRATYPQEVRVVAAQSLQKIDPAAAKGALSAAELKSIDLEPMPYDRASEAPGVRQRCYPRTKLRRGLAAKMSTTEGELSAVVHEISLGGGLLSCEHQIHPGISAKIRIQSRMRSFAAKIILRDTRGGFHAFEIVDIDAEDRTKLRNQLSRGH
jgi:PilZ domain